MRPLPDIDPALHRQLRTIESAQGPTVTLDGREVLLLCSNDYLGLAGDQRVRDAAARAAQDWGAGAGASPLVSGHMGIHRELEQRLAELEPVPAQDALRTIAAFRLALPRTILRFAGGRELTLGDLGARQGMVGGINAVIVGNYLTTLGRDPQEDLDLLAELSMPVKELSKTL